MTHYIPKFQHQHPQLRRQAREANEKKVPRDIQGWVGFRAWDLGFRVWDLGFRVWDLRRV